MSRLTSIADEALIALDQLSELPSRLVSPTLRLGVTGLSRAGKTVFITSLLHNLLHGGRLPLFEAYTSGRISAARLRPQPAMEVPRFAYEDHLETLLEARQWPESTSNISQLRISLNYESSSLWNRTLGSGTLNIDIVDYPGEWLLDLPLLGLSYEEWSRQSLALSHLPNREKLAEKWHREVKKAKPDAPADETLANALARTFTDYLKACRDDKHALSTLPPGRFLMPGDLAGSPALTFTPLILCDDQTAETDSLHAMMADRFEAYKRVVVKPFFREHFARLDRQIVLVDALQALNAGPDALRDLETALTDILQCFKPGSSSWLSSVVTRRIDRILFAATKADHLHHESHDRLERLLASLVNNAIDRARFAGAAIQVSALSAVRATQEAWLEEDGERLPVITGVPLAGAVIDGKTFDGTTETAIFPGDLPENPKILLKASGDTAELPELAFVRFRPPELETTAEGLELSLPHIRLDRALQFLLGDWLE